VADPALREELLAMLAADQAARAEEGTDGFAGDRERTERLRRITAERGWPTRTLVGADGATAAWAIAQHSDLDPQVQEQFLALMRDAVAAGEADPGELAYLVDRVGGRAPGGRRPTARRSAAGRTDAAAGPLADPTRGRAARRGGAAAPLADYLAELARSAPGPERPAAPVAPARPRPAPRPGGGSPRCGAGSPPRGPMASRARRRICRWADRHSAVRADGAGAATSAAATASGAGPRRGGTRSPLGRASGC
jgi:hypothetical protein